MPAAVNRRRWWPVDGWPRWLAPRLGTPRCLCCGEAAADRRGFCPPCRAALPWNHGACLRCAIPLPGGDATCGACLQRPPPVSETRAAFVYGDPVDRLLPRFKFHRDLAAGRALAEAMAERLALLPRPEALVAVPLHRARLRQRGYDQALELAKPLSRALGIPLLHDALQRVRTTAPQSRLDAAARRRNLRGAFAVAAGAALPAHVALVDDVMTTGATLHAAAKALRRAGVARVDAWVCARVP